MASLLDNNIEQRLAQALKARDGLLVEVLRGLKNRMQNDAIATGKQADGERFVDIVRSEVKRRNEAVEAYKAGGRPELAEKELNEAAILQAYLPKAPEISEISAKANQIIEQNHFIAKDFGKAMAELKKVFGIAADGAILAKVLKEKLR